jgi:PAS domain S-box-containing protein
MDDIFNLQKLTSAISASMVMASSESLDGEINRALDSMLSFLEIARIGLLTVDESTPMVNVDYASYVKDVPQVSKQVNLAALFPWTYDMVIRRGQTMVMAGLEDLPPEAEEDRRSHTMLGNKSVLVIPLFIGSRVHHLLTLDARTAERCWPEEVIAQTRLLGEIFVSALQRREAESNLRRTNERLDIAALSAEIGLWELNLDTGSLWATPKAKEHFGFDPDTELTLARLMDVIHPDDHELIGARVEESRHTREELMVEYRIRTSDGSLRWMTSRGRSHWDDRHATSLLGVTVDVTARKELELQLQAYIREIESLKVKLERENQYLRLEVATAEGQGEIMGTSEAMRAIMKQVSMVAQTGSTVLLQGETGTGKNLVASTIHRLSGRGRKAMVRVNCAALPGPLVESELFGREKGAYTGALSRQAGRFELADGSTLFLDEIAEMSLETQAKLLRVIQDGEFERLGSSKTIKVNVRIIAASNRDLAKEVEAGRFRGDLYYRLNIFPIRVPPLRERPEDIPQLVMEFIREFGDRMGKRILRVAHKDMQLLTSYSWPGNIRELRNVIEHSLIISPGDTLVLQRLTASPELHDADASLEEVERRHIQAVLKATGGRIKGFGGAAERLRINPSTLYSRMRKLGIGFKQP